MKTLKDNMAKITSGTTYESEVIKSKLDTDRDKLAIDTNKFRKACGAFATGITVVAAKTDTDMQVMTANGFMSVSLNPSLIVVSVGNQQKIHNTISKSGQYGVSVLGTSQIEVSNHFGGKFNPDLKIEFKDKENIPYLSKNIAYFLAKVKSSYVVGDHTLFIGEADQFGESNQKGPLLYSKSQYINIK